MRHRVRKGKLGLKTGHRMSLLRNLCTELFKHGRITTTDARAKELKRFSEKIITIARTDTVHSRRLVNTKIKDRNVLTKLFDTIAPSYVNRPGGYTRIIKLNHRRGDAAPISAIELVDLDVPFKIDDSVETKSEDITPKEKD
ncbi:MAG: 50S ribosomal protein L17 [Thermodesulfobacteriota bacterium]|nr:50S ribosomal protein L17 [Thermodesulfobacteriota bacterium]MEE2974874.1 50S ribosomal protein L17 [Thermodesulfobacteriota bacterium]|tara:strand:+ start:1958 stop:2383 length:426 start_codon:yes stop_codon:yes gene_type:complete